MFSLQSTYLTQGLLTNANAQVDINRWENFKEIIIIN